MRKTLQKLEQDQRKGKKGLSGDADVEVRRRSLLGLLLFVRDYYCLVCQGLLVFVRDYYGLVCIRDYYCLVCIRDY